jgi:hypothetical protein
MGDLIQVMPEEIPRNRMHGVGADKKNQQKAGGDK